MSSRPEHFGRGHRGRGRPWRGGGGRGGARGRSDPYSSDSKSYQNNPSESRGRGSSRPPGLRGKDIGLFYRDLAKKNSLGHKEQVNANIRTGFSATLTRERQLHLQNVIEGLKLANYAQSESHKSFQRKYQSNVQANAVIKTESVPIKQESYDSTSLLPSLAPQSSSSSTSKPQSRYFNWESDHLDENESKLLYKLFSATPDAGIDQKLLQELEDKEKSKSYQKMQEFRRSLPAFKLKDEIVSLVENNQVSVISGETGCGKTTQVAQFILDSEIRAGRGSSCNIICTQPRRISAISVSERVSSERDEKLGHSVGYTIRLESCLPSRPSGIITFMTTGVIFQCLKSNPLLNNVSHLIVDEIHERSCHSDFLLAILKDLLIHRPNLKVILMSATMNARDFSNYFGIQNTSILNIPGFTFPITEYYLEDAIAHTGFEFENASQQQQGGFNRPRHGRRFKQQRDAEQEFHELMSGYLNGLHRENRYSDFVLNQLAKPSSEEFNVEFVQAIVEHICTVDRKCGAILIFSTGWDEISKIISQLESSGKFPSSKFRIFPLHSLMPTVNQREIFERPPLGVRKIIVATQIAETSITIDDITYVIDMGKIKLGNFDENDNLATLDTEWVALANAQQRRGRAGRVQHGNVYHLFSQARKDTLDKYKKPEVLRTRLEELVLQIKILKLGKAKTFLTKLMDPPSELSMNLALERLLELHAIDEEENLTPLGFHLAHLPMDPQTAKMILLGAIFSCVDPVFSMAASLSFKSPFYIPLGKEKIVDGIRRRFAGNSKSDHILLARVISAYEDAKRDRWERQFCYKNFLSENTLRMLIDMKQQFAEHLVKLGFLPDSRYKAAPVNRNSNNDGVITAISGAGLYPNVVHINFHGRNRRALLREHFPGQKRGRRVKFHPSSVNFNQNEFESPYIVYFKKMKSSDIFLHDTTMVNPFVLIFFGGRLNWKLATNPDAGDVVCKREEGEEEKEEAVEHSSSKYDSVLVGEHELVFQYPSGRNFRYIVESLRTELDSFFHHKVNNPGFTDWDVKDSKETRLLRAICDILTSEYATFTEKRDDNWSDDEDDDDDDF